MKNLFLLLVVACCSLQASAQINLDSLYSVWQDPEMPDSSRAQAYLDYAWKGFGLNLMDSTLYMTNELMDFCEKTQNYKVIGTCFTIQGMISRQKGDYIGALNLLEKGLNARQQINDHAGVARSLNQIGSIYRFMGDFDRTLNYYTRALSLERQYGTNRGVGHCLGNMGGAYAMRGENEIALKYYYEELALHEADGHKDAVGKALFDIGYVYLNQGKCEEGLDYSLRGLKISEEEQDSWAISTCLGGVANAYQCMGDFESAALYFEKGLEFSEASGHQHSAMVSLHGLGEIKRLTGNYSKAIEYCSQAVERSVKMKMIEREKSACKCLYKTYREIDNNDQAVVYLEKLRAIDDSLNLVETAKKLQSMEFEKQVFADSLHVEEEKRFLDQKHYEELKHQKLVRNAFMGGFAVVLLFAGVFLKQRNRIGQEKERSDELLLNILPEETATELKEKGHSDAQLIEQVTVLFTDFKGFTSLSEKVTPKELVADLHACFSQFDQICEKYGIEKIKTIGDAYMAAGGLPSPNNTHAKDVVQAALEMAQVVEKGKADKIAANLPFFEIRIGVHTGPVVAGIVGVKKFQYDIWGDSVNTASRMESSGEVGKVNISEATYELLKDDAQFSFESRGKIEAKGKGEMEMYFVSEKG